MPRVPRVLDKLRRDRFLRMTGALVGGTASAQLVAILALPLLTRVYSAEHFSVLAVYVAALTLFGTIACLRIEAAIPLPEDEEEAVRLLALAMLAVAGTTFLLFLLVATFGRQFANSLDRDHISPYLWLVPIGVAMMGAYSAFQYMAMRQQAFGLIARTRLTQSVAGLGTQLGFGAAGVAPIGLLIGHAVMSGAGVVALAKRSLGSANLRSDVLAPTKLIATLRTYKRFPQFSVAEELANNLGIQLPVVLIGLLVVGPEAGLLFLAMRVIGVPLGVVGGAVSQVYYANAAEYLRQGRLDQETVLVVKRLSASIALPVICVAPFSPELFVWAFGQEWGGAGVMLVWMLPWYLFRLVSSPISMVMHVKMRQPLLLALTLWGLLSRVAPLGLVLTYKPELAVPTYALTSALFYASMTVACLLVANVPKRGILSLLGGVVVTWAAVAWLAFTLASLI